MTTRINYRKQILLLVREMAVQYPHMDYCYAREHFGLLGKIRSLCNNQFPTAKQCWEAVGLDRSHLVDEFEFSQDDLTNAVRHSVQINTPFKQGLMP